MENIHVSNFGDDLDALVDRYRDLVADDLLSMAEVVGTLQFKAFLLMSEACEESED